MWAGPASALPAQTGVVNSTGPSGVRIAPNITSRASSSSNLSYSAIGLRA